LPPTKKSSYQLPLSLKRRVGMKRQFIYTPHPIPQGEGA
jgi:hypothetical protein